MPVTELSRDRVEERLGALEESYASFSVNQTTLSVSPPAYERARERCFDGLADVYVRVYNDADDVLLVRENGDWVVPQANPRTSESLERGTRRAVADETGVDCRITDLDRVTILGVRDDEDPDREPVYRLVPVFAAERTGGSPDGDASWRPELPDASLPEL